MNPVRNAFLGLIAILPVLAYATGGESGGGGAQIESAFRIRARDLISQVGSNPGANALCDSATLLKSLDNTEIRVVDQLLNPTTHAPITDRELDAWTVPGSDRAPGDMQLIKTSWNGFLNGSSAAFSSRSVEVLILHEIYRTTPSCNDEHFVISDRIPALLGGFIGQNILAGCTKIAQDATTVCTAYNNDLQDQITREQLGLLPAGSSDAFRSARNQCYGVFIKECSIALGHSPGNDVSVDPAHGPGDELAMIEGTYTTEMGFAGAGQRKTATLNILRDAQGNYIAGLRLNETGAGGSFQSVTYDPSAGHLRMESDTIQNGLPPNILIVDCGVSLPTLTCTATSVTAGIVWSATFTRQ